MRVLVKRAPYVKTVSEFDLCEVLKPTSYGPDGRLEMTEAQAAANADAIGRLLEYMVERNQLSLDKACEIAGFYGQVTPL